MPGGSWSRAIRFEALAPVRGGQCPSPGFGSPLAQVHLVWPEAPCRSGTGIPSSPNAPLMWFLLGGDSQPPSNRPLSGQVPGVFVQRKRLGGIGNSFTTTPAASIDAGSAGRFSGLILLVELRTDADLYVVATLEECHESPSFVVAAKHRP